MSIVKRQEGILYAFGFLNLQEWGPNNGINYGWSAISLHVKQKGREILQKFVKIFQKK